MTFVAQSFNVFADDLLTALTGGMSREEHQFVGVVIGDKPLKFITVHIVDKGAPLYEKPK